MTEQLISHKHAPSRIVLDYVYVLNKYLGYEVILFSCPSNYVLKDNNIYSCAYANSLGENDYSQIKYSFKDMSFIFFQVSMCEQSELAYKEMFSIIYDFNPIFVFGIGVRNPVIDLTNSFTTLVSLGVTIGIPVSESDILLRSGYNEELTKSQNAYISDNQIIVDDLTSPFIVDESDKIITREDLKLPNNKILIAIVGNRLELEIDNSFICIMEKMLIIDNRIMFVIIGKMNKKAEIGLKNRFEQSRIINNVIFLGYMKDLYSAYSCMNLYLNPIRRGGGISAVIAMATGLPVITFPDCDVAENVGEDFVVKMKKNF